MIKAKHEDVPAIVYVWPVGWATRRTILTPIAERVQRPYHQAHYDKQQLTASAVAALFIQLIEAGEIVMERGKLQWEDSLEGMAKGSKTICQRLFRNKNSTVESAVVNLLDKPVPFVWDHYDDVLAAEAESLGYSPEPQPIAERPVLPWMRGEEPTPRSPLWRAEQASGTLLAQASVFRRKKPRLFKTIWSSVVRGIQAREAGVKVSSGAAAGGFAGDMSWLDGLFDIGGWSLVLNGSSNRDASQWCRSL